MTADNKFWAFPKIADTAAQENHKERWRLFADDYLGALVGDYWRDRFEQVFHHPGGFASQTPDPITREVTWKVLGGTRPLAFHGVQEGEHPDWEALAQAAPEDYGPGLSPPGIRSTFMVQLLLPEAEARDWIRRQGKTKLPPGRPQKYDWDAFWREIVKVADMDGLPETKAELVEHMSEWCEIAWGEEPASSVIREKIARLYNKGNAGK